MRGRLIKPFILEIALLDRAATAQDPDGAGSLESGYDPDFHEPIRIPDGSLRGASARKEEIVQVQAQIEPKEFDLLNMYTGGMSNDSKLTVICWAPELERKGLIDPMTGNVRFSVGDRLIRILSKRGKVVCTVPENPGLYLVEPQPRAFGLGSDRNLIMLRFWDRKRTGRGVGEVATNA